MKATTVTPNLSAPVLRLLLVDVHKISRASSRLLLETITGFEVVGETSQHREALEMAATLHPDVLIISMRVNGSTGPDTTRDILKLHPEIRVIFWTLFDDPEYVRSALAAGAHAYVLKQDPAQEIEIAIEKVRLGQSYLSPNLPHVA